MTNEMLELYEVLLQSNVFNSELELVKTIYADQTFEGVRYTNVMPRQEPRSTNVISLSLVYTPINKWKSQDVAVLRVKNKEHYSKHYLGFSKKTIKTGELIYSLGHPIGMFWQLRQGLVSQTYDVIGFWTDMYVAPGCSGGPTLNERGEIIGLAIQTNRDHSIGWHTSSLSILNVLRRSKVMLN